MTVKHLARLMFKPAARYPADPRAVFILALSVFSSLTAVALQEGPPSLQGVMPEWAVIVWGLMLGLGSLLTLGGMMRQSVNGIITEQIGSVVVAAATLFYSGIAFWQLGPVALQTVGIILAWGLSCGLRWFQLQALINSAIGRAQKRAVLDALEVQLAARVRREKANQRFRVDEDDHLGQWGTGQ